MTIAQNTSPRLIDETKDAKPQLREALESSLNKKNADNIIVEQRQGKDGVSIHRYRRGEFIGQGGSAKVYRCIALDTGKAYAIKVISKEYIVKTRKRQSVSQA